jgi:DNA ligase 1
MNKLPMLYKCNVNGAIQQWEMVVEGNTYYSIEGQVGGVLTQNKPTVCSGKNIGRANETTPESQALAEATAKWTKKVEKGFVEDITRAGDGPDFFECQLAHKFNDFKDKVVYPVLMSYKIDGLRMIATKDRLTTRNGKAFNSCPHILKILSPIFEKHPNWVIDGEIYSDKVPFEKIVSLTRKKKPTPEEISESEEYCQLWIFDGVIDNKQEGFATRFSIIKNEIKSIIGDNKAVKFVENEMANSYQDIVSKHDEYITQGWEGIMIRVPNSPYENKRSKNLLKLKNFLDEEFIIVDVIEGTGNRSGMAGNLIYNLPDGRSFSSSIRGGEVLYKELLANKNKYIGKKATVRFQEYTQDGMPRFPVTVTIDPMDR